MHKAYAPGAPDPDDIDVLESPRYSTSPSQAKSGRIYPCSAEEFADLQEAIDETECADDITPHDVSHRTSLTGNGVKQRFSVSRYTNPNASDASEYTNEMSPQEITEACSGMAYLLFTLVLSLYYLTMLGPAMANDLWWSGFNASGAQSYLSDAFNVQLNLYGDHTFDLTANDHGISKDYSTSYTPIEISPVYPRYLLHDSRGDFPHLIAGLRQLFGPESITTQYCWVDFNRTWEVAHTEMRQRRCNARYAGNAAMYWETMIRLTEWRMWLTKFMGQFAVTIGMPISALPGGSQWLNRTVNAFESVESEAKYWRDSGMTMFVMQYTNLETWGVGETIRVLNAFGAEQSISIKRVASKLRGALWTTAMLHWGPRNDLNFASSLGYSFIRTSPNNPRFTTPCNYTIYLRDPKNYMCEPCLGRGCSPTYESALGLLNTPTVQAIRGFIGPFGSIDAFFVPAPNSLKRLYSELSNTILTLMNDNHALREKLQSIPSFEVDPVPPGWSNPRFMYMGGDPTCPQRQPMQFIQPQFSFEAACPKQVRETIRLTGANVFSSLLVMTKLLPSNPVENLCSVCPTFSDSCADVLTPAIQALNIVNKLHTENDWHKELIADTYKETSKMDVKLIQFFLDPARSSVGMLQQKLLNDPPDLWDFYGWIYLFDWVRASREVVSFEGDEGIHAVLSDKYAPIINQAQALEVPKSACQYLWVVSVVVSSVLVSVGVMFSSYSFLLHGRIVGRNLFQFNRIVGAVWLGRPLLMVRGMTAVIMLSTSPLSFVNRHGYTKFNFEPRTFIQTMIVSGEAMWISYVINDFLLLLTRNSQPLFAPMSTILGWFIYVIMDASSPYRVESALKRECTIDIAIREITCFSGMIEVGDVNRAYTLVMVQVGCIVASFLGVKAWQVLRQIEPVPYHGHLLLSGTATAFLRKDVLASGAWMIDRASCVMCGLLTYRDYIFDLKLWLLVEKDFHHAIKWDMQIFQPPELSHTIPSSGQTASSLPSKVEVSFHQPRKAVNRLLTVAGLIYMCSTIFGSVTYLSLTATNMANDFWWANYNSSREHVFVARLYNDQLIMRPRAGSIRLDDPVFVDYSEYNTSIRTDVSVTMNPLYISQVKSTDSTLLAQVIRGLRRMDACLAPWIATQYCWLDFEKRWEMAVTPARQRRCARNYTNNGAVYLATLLRNVDWDGFQRCWGTSLEFGIVAGVTELDGGAVWWQQMQSTRVSVQQELDMWGSFNITTYITDWQNYKTTGIVETFSIENAFGFSYPMTLKHTNGSFMIDSQTSMKMSWGFASHLWAVASKSTLAYKMSLIRQSKEFVFSNVSIEALLVQNGTLLSTDLNRGAYSIFRSIFGPFGSVDIKIVPVPESLSAFTTALRDKIVTLQGQSKEFSKQFFMMQTVNQFSYMPLSWLRGGVKLIIGGNILCGDMAGGLQVSRGMSLFTGFLTSCGTGLGEYVAPAALGMLGAIIGTNISRRNMSASEIAVICTQAVTMQPAICQSILMRQRIQFLRNTTLFSDPSILASLHDLAEIAQRDVHALGVEIFQYGQRDVNGRPTNQALHMNIFDPRQANFHYIGWLLAIDWSQALREVLSFQGDISSINVITAPQYSVGSLVNPLEIPVNVASYIRYTCLYVTCIIICVAVLATIYLVANRGYVEGLNLFELNRVAGIVWIGRTFLFIRSMAAICLLSTQVLNLEEHNFFYRFVPASSEGNDDSTASKLIFFFKTFLAAGEVSWLGFVLNDILMVFTAQYTTAYVLKCNFMVWGMAAMLTWAVPATHTATLQRSCEHDHVDFQLVCTTGTISIGSFTRFLSLIVICVVSIFVCYLFERVRHPKLPPSKQSSLFLSSSAKYVFDPDRWIDNDVYYIDPASAVINGIISLQTNNTFYIFDLKIWRLFVIEQTSEKRKKLERNGDYHLLSAIPLSD